jgi:hypothetical protein
MLVSSAGLPLASSKSKSSAVLPGALINYDSKQYVPNQPRSEIPAVCCELIDSDDWIKKYGLATNRLRFQDILSMIGFKKAQDYYDQFRKTIGSRYAAGVYLQTENSQGKIYNVS